MIDLYANVILFDTVCVPFTGISLEETGMGASESQSILLLEELVKLGKKVICLNNTKVEIEYKGVLYLPNTKIFEYRFRCDHLILLRNSTIPKILHKKCYQWITDNNGPQNLPYYDLIENNKCKLITLTKYSNDQFPYYWEKYTINYMIPDWIYDYTIPEQKKDFIYASSIMKGYGATIQYWLYLKNKGLLENKRLNVCLPGYDNPKGDISRQELNIDYLGTLTLRQVVDKIASCECMFYVNMVPETFCVSVVLSQILQTPANVLCLNGVGALDEVNPTGFHTTDVSKFINYFTTSTRSTKLAHGNYRPSVVMSSWKRLIN